MVGCFLLPRFVIEAEVSRAPEWAGRPLVVEARGKVFALSAEAERAGLRVGLATGQAKAICPDVVVRLQDDEYYAAFQERVLARAVEYVPALEVVGLTDFFVDLPHGPLHAQVLTETADAIRSFGLTCREGAGANKVVARIAALVGPGTVVAKRDEARFLAPLSSARLPLEEKALARLEDLGLSTIGLVQHAPASVLARHLGTAAKRVKELAQGMDSSPIRPTYPPATVEARAALPEATEAEGVIEEVVREVAARIAEELARRGQTCRRLALTVETEAGACTRQRTLTHATAQGAEVLLAARYLLGKAEVRAGVNAVRLRASELSRRTEVQLSLLDSQEGREAREQLATAVARIRREFGAEGARWAGECERPRRERVLACLQERR